MTQPLVALANAHRALVANPDTTGIYLPTARKIETTLLAILDTTPAGAVTGQDCVALLNSGSLKALKRAPLREAALRGGYNQEGPDPAFILAQGPAYVKEARKRGFGVDKVQRLAIVKRMVIENTSLDQEAIALDGDVDAGFVDQLLGLVLPLTGEQAARGAPIAAKLLKAGAKHKPDALATSLEALCIVHDPALAGPLVFKAMAAYALLGVKAPAKDAFEHDGIQAAVLGMCSTAGRAALKAELGDIATWLARGAPLPAALGALERARATYRARTQSRW
jgi:hypothetical protein